MHSGRFQTIAEDMPNKAPFPKGAKWLIERPIKGMTFQDLHFPARWKIVVRQPEHRKVCKFSVVRMSLRISDDFRNDFCIKAVFS